MKCIPKPITFLINLVKYLDISLLIKKIISKVMKKKIKVMNISQLSHI